MLRAHVIFHLPGPIGIDLQGHFVIRHDVVLQKNARGAGIAHSGSRIPARRGPRGRQGR